MITKRLSAAVATHNVDAYLAPVSGIILCASAMPTEAQVNAAGADHTQLLLGAKTITFGGIPRDSMLCSDSNASHLLVYSADLPNPATVSSTFIGKLSWGILLGQCGYAVVDVGLANSGAVIQVDTVDVTVGKPVSILSVSFKLWG